MWLQTTFGSFSINQSEDDRTVGMLTITSDSRDDLQTLVARFMPNAILQYSENKKQPPFIRAPHAKVTASMAQAVSEIYYSDFLQAVEQIEGDCRAKCFANVAYQLSDLQFEKREYEFDPSSTVGTYPQKILELGLEGGSVILWGYKSCGRRGFSVETNDCSLVLIGEAEEPDNQELFLQSWNEAIDSMPNSWTCFYPIYIAEDYWPLISAELRARGIVSAQSDWLNALKKSK